MRSSFVVTKKCKIIDIVQTFTDLPPPPNSKFWTTLSDLWS